MFLLELHLEFFCVEVFAPYQVGTIFGSKTWGGGSDSGVGEINTIIADQHSDLWVTEVVFISGSWHANVMGFLTNMEQEHWCHGMLMPWGS